MKIEAKKIGNSTGFIVPSGVATRMGIDVGQVFYLTEKADGSLNFSPYDPDFDAAMKASDEIMDEYRDTFAVLAK
jgi:antitoxin component of MazEF toxin-antitoxin module